jgi:hypothetical protein
MCCSSLPPPEPRRHAETDAAARHELLLWPLTSLAPARCALLRRPLLRPALPRPCSWSRDRRRAHLRPRHDNLRDAVEEHRAPRRPPPSSLPLSYALSLSLASMTHDWMRTTDGTTQHQGQYRVLATSPQPMGIGHLARGSRMPRTPSPPLLICRPDLRRPKGGVELVYRSVHGSMSTVPSQPIS